MVDNAVLEHRAASLKRLALDVRNDGSGLGPAVEDELLQLASDGRVRERAGYVVCLRVDRVLPLIRARRARY